jgi:acetyl esterase/lipase
MIQPESHIYSPEKALLLDLYRPAGPVRALVLYLHGGGFLKGRRAEPAATTLAARLLPQGVAVASADYRLRVPLSAFPDAQAQAIEQAQARSKSAGLTLAARLCGSEMVAALQDANEALTFLRRLLSGVPVVVCGVSAGGILGLSLAHPPKGMALAQPDAVMAISAALVQPWRLTAAGPPAVLLHGHPDRVIGLENPRLALRRAVARGADLQLVETGIGGHNTQVGTFFDGADSRGAPYFNLLTDLIERVSDARNPPKTS